MLVHRPVILDSIEVQAPLVEEHQHTPETDTLNTQKGRQESLLVLGKAGDKVLRLFNTGRINWLLKFFFLHLI
jgi:hypothetical protein